MQDNAAPEDKRAAPDAKSPQPNPADAPAAESSPGDRKVSSPRVPMGPPADADDRDRLPPGADSTRTPSPRPGQGSLIDEDLDEDDLTPRVPMGPAPGDDRLPPGAAASAKTGAATTGPATGGSSEADDLLPPETELGEVDAMLPPALAAVEEPGQQVALPDSARGGPDLQLREPIKTVGEGDQRRELVTLSAEEKARRRLRRNLILWACGFMIMVVTTMLLLYFGPAF